MVRFDKPCTRITGAMGYFSEHMAKQDYLTEGGEAKLTWSGEGAIRLGLSDHVQEDHFARLCAGRDPFSNARLTPRDNGANRRVCYFGQISAPKDVSIAHLVGGDQRIAGWWDASVKETLKEIEGVTITRVRKGGAVEERSTGNMVAAIVTHDTSRALDPQLHTHVCVMNVTYDPVEKRWKAVEPRGFYKYQSYLREVSYNKLAEKMREGGYQIEKARSGGFNIKGFPAKLRDDFSKRREEIERVADEMKTKSQDALHSIAAKTRAEKAHFKAEQLKTRWMSESVEHLPMLREVVARAIPGQVAKMEADRALDLGKEHVFERESVADERILLREALIAGRGEVRLDELRNSLASQIRAGELIQTGRMVASRETLAMEKSVIEWATKGKGSLPIIGNFTAQESLSAEQNLAAEKLLRMKDRAVILIGDAGAGKSTTLPVIVRGIHETGNLTFACAPSSGAVQELREKLGIQADTIQQLLVNDKLQEQVVGRTIIVDEAGLLSVRQMHALCQLAERQKCRLLLVGDVKQHHSVEAGDALRALQKYSRIETVRLKEIHRQRNEDYRKVVQLLAAGKPYAGFGQLDRLGGVKEQKDWSKLLAQAASTYLEKISGGQSCLAISPVWSEVNTFTGVVRQRLKDQGLLGEEERSYKAVQSLQWTRSLKAQLSNYQTGDVLTFHRDGKGFSKHEMATVVGKNDGGLILERKDGVRTLFDPREQGHFDVGLSRYLPVSPGEKLLVRANFPTSKSKNGDLVTVEQVRDDGTLLLRDGRTIPNHFRQFTYGYASTSHAAQGKTVDHGILLMGESGIKAANLKQAYVSNSRFRDSQTILTVDKQAAFDSMASESERPLAMEIIMPPIRKDEKASQSVKELMLDWNVSPGTQGIKT